MLSITGDIEIKEAQNLVDRYLGNWTSPEKKPLPVALPRPPEGNVFFLSKDIPQSILIFGFLAPAKSDSKDYYNFKVLDFIIGSGGLHSRIFQEIRTNMGLAYSTGSFYNAKSDYGLFGAYAITKSESTTNVTERLRKILRDIGEKLVPPEDLKMAKRAIHNSFFFSFTSAEQIAFQKLLIEYEGLQDNFLVTYRSKIENVTAEDIRHTALNYLAPGKTVILIIGNEKAYQDIYANFGKVIRIETSF